MPQDPSFYLTMGIFALIALGFIAVTALRGWRDWIALKHAELDHLQAGASAQPSTTSRIEVADLKERVKKLEAIAAGIDI